MPAPCLELQNKTTADPASVYFRCCVVVPTRQVRESDNVKKGPPFEELHNKCDAATKAYYTACAQQDVAKHHYDMCLLKKDRLDTMETSLESAVRNSKEKVDKALQVKKVTEGCRDHLVVASALYKIACTTLEGKQVTLHKADAGIGLNGKRRRSTASNDGIVAAKSVKVGAESAGKAAARSGPVGDVSAPAVIEPDAASVRHLQACRLEMGIAQKDVEDAKAKVAVLQAEIKTMKTDADWAARKGETLEELTCVAANDTKALNDFRLSAEYQKIPDDLSEATFELTKAKAATCLAGIIKEEAERSAYPHAFPEEGWEAVPSERPANRVVPPPTRYVYVPPPRLQGVYRYSPAQAGCMLVDEELEQAEAEMKREKAEAARQEAKGDEEAAGKEGGNEKGSHAKKAEKAAAVAQRGAVRQSSRSSRGKRAKLFEEYS